MKKELRLKVYNKYNNHCAYCGELLEYKNMQVDHIRPIGYYRTKIEADNFGNLNPSCRLCNHYKRARKLESFRDLILTLHERLNKIYIFKVAIKYGIFDFKKWDGKFYFERENNAN